MTIYKLSLNNSDDFALINTTDNEKKKLGAIFMSRNTDGMKYVARDKMKEVYKTEIESTFIPNTAIEFSAFQAVTAFQNKDSKEFKYRSGKDLTWSIRIDGRRVAKHKFYPQSIQKYLEAQNYSKMNIKDILSKFYISIAKSSGKICDIIYNKRNNKFYLAMPENHTQKLGPDIITQNNVVSIDPGQFPYLTYYSATEYGQIGIDWHKNPKKLEKSLDKLMGRADKKSGLKFCKRATLLRAAERCRLKITRKIIDMQRKAAHYLCSRFKIILLPELKNSDLNQKERDVKLNGQTVSKPRSYGPKLARTVCSSAHYRFRQFMVQSAQKSGSKIIFCSEAHTSKTCTRCGNSKEDLGRAKIYNCTNCGLIVNRDYGGARNIMLRNLNFLSDGSAP